MYNASLKSKMDYDGSIAFAEQKAYLKGKEEMTGVIAFAEDKAFDKGRHEEAVEIARQMLMEKEPLEKIARYTKLSIKELEAL